MIKKSITLFAVLFLLAACSNQEADNNLNNEQANAEEVIQETADNNNEQNDNETDSNSNNDQNGTENEEDHPELNDNEIEEMVEEQYEDIIDILIDNESDVAELVNQHSDDIDNGAFLESGVDTDLPFYDDMYDLLYPQVNEYVADEGMGTIIDSEYRIYMNPRNPTPFSPTFDQLEVSEKDGTHFTIDQSAKADDQQYVFTVDFVKEDDEWKLFGAEKQH